MIKRMLIVTSMIAILLSACGKPTTEPVASATEPATKTQAPTATFAPTDTPTPEPTETATATPETPIPTNAPNCTNRAAFVIDVTFPDESPVNAATTFTKTWRIKNTGTCVWGPEYKLVFYSEESMGAPTSVPLPVIFPNQTGDISVTLVAPAKGGKHRGNFVIRNPAGLIMKIDNDSRLWVLINVIEVATGTAAPATTPAGTTAPGATIAPTNTSKPGTANTPSGAGGPGFAPVSCAFTLDTAKVAETINAINAYRAQNNLAPYNVNEQLTAAAQAHANDMACNQLFFHNGSNGSTPASRVAASGYAASSVTENVYGSYPPLTGQGTVTWWINDQTDIRHNQNLISIKYVDIGVGYAFYNNFGYYVVVFAAP